MESGMRFWTSYQFPLSQAALIEDKKVIKTIPLNGPKTPARRVDAVGSYNDKLVLLRRSSWEIWSKDGEDCELQSYDKYLYGPHAVEQVDDKLLISGSGHDLFYIINMDGQVVWEWFGHEYGLGGYPDHLYKENWVPIHVAGRANPVPIDGWHYNSIFLLPDGKHFLAGSLNKSKIVKIPIYGKGGEVIETSKHHGAHSPIINHKNQLVYGLENGICCDGEIKVSYLSWPKYIRWIGDCYAVTHELGITFIDEDWRPMWNIPLPRPFRFTLLEY